MSATWSRSCRAEERQAQQTLSRAVERGSFSSQRHHGQPSHLNFALVGDVVGHQSLRETRLRQRRDRPYQTGLCASNVMQLA